MSLTMRDIRIRYKQSLLGIAWAMFTPLAMMLIFTFVFSRYVRFETGNIPYSIFAYCGLLPWTFFAGGLTNAIGSLVSNSSLVTKIYFPREVFPLSSILARFVDFCIASIILVGLMFFYKVPVHSTVLLVPAIVLLQIILMVGLGLILSMANLFFRDVKIIFEVVILLWMFITPVIYPMKAIGTKFQWILLLNPMAPIINSYRRLILEGRLPEINQLMYSIVISLILFIAGAYLFHKSEHLFAENI